MPRSTLARRFVARWRLYTLWVVLILAAVSGVWAQSHGSGVTGALRALAYLTLCGAALFTPGYLLELAGVDAPRRRLVSLVILIVAAGLVAGTIVGSALWATPPLILLAGNAIWTLDTIDLERELAERAAGG